MLIFAFAAVSVLGLPPSTLFAQKVLLLQQGLSYPLVIAILVLGPMAGVAYFLPLIYEAFFRGGGHTASSKGPGLLGLVSCMIPVVAMAVLFFVFGTGSSMLLLQGF